MAVERTGHTTGSFSIQVSVACGPPLTAGVMPMKDRNLSISLRQATPTDSDFAYHVKKVALGEYVKKTYGKWDEAFQRKFHERQWEPAGTQMIAVIGETATHWHMEAKA